MSNSSSCFAKDRAEVGRRPPPPLPPKMHVAGSALSLQVRQMYSRMWLPGF